METYEDLIESTRAIFNLLKTKPNEKPKTTRKYQNLFIGFEESYVTESGEELEAAESEQGEKEPSGNNMGEETADAKLEDETVGTRIRFLPGDKNSLLERLD